MTYTFEEIDTKEHALYAKIQNTLDRHDFTKLFEQTETLDTVSILHTELQSLQKEHLKLTSDLIARKDLVWLKEETSDLGLIDGDNRDCVNAFISEEYRYLTEQVLDFRNITDSDALNIKSSILKIMSRPTGQRLILKLNRSKKNNPDISIIFHPGSELKILSDKKNSKLGKYIERHGCFKKNPATILDFHYPSDYYKESVQLKTGMKNVLIYSVPFISITHELIHCLHRLRGSDQSLRTFPHSFASPITWQYYNGLFADKEELRTIEKNRGISEETIRLEHTLPLRGGHNSAHIDHTNQIYKLIILALLRHGITDFSRYCLPNNISFTPILSVLLKQAEINGLPDSTYKITI